MMRRWFVVVLLAAAGVQDLPAWGYTAHRLVADNAAAALPREMAALYAASRKALSDAAIEPDSILRKNGGEAEDRNHYIDIDRLAKPPFEDFPVQEDEALRRFGAKRVSSAGRLPWRIVEVQEQLRSAFESSDWPLVIRLSGWLSHYVADAYQPLHTTRNHDGQRTCNKGIHSAFETDMINRSKDAYRRETVLPAAFEAKVIPRPGEFIIREIAGNFDLVEPVLKADTGAIAEVKRNGKDYYEEMERRAGPLARRQLTRAAATVASLWYSAWDSAGRPDLPATEGRP